MSRPNERCRYTLTTPVAPSNSEGSKDAVPIATSAEVSQPSTVSREMQDVSLLALTGNEGIYGLALEHGPGFLGTFLGRVSPGLTCK